MSLKEITEQNKPQIHFYFGGPNNRYPDGTVHTYNLTELLIELESERIDTTQIFLCKTSLFKKGYRIFIHPVEGPVFEIKLGSDNPNTQRIIKEGHNLVNLLIAGEFNGKDIRVC